jgi:hypothetical protein
MSEDPIKLILEGITLQHNALQRTIKVYAALTVIAFAMAYVTATVPNLPWIGSIGWVVLGIGFLLNLYVTQVEHDIFIDRITNPDGIVEEDED